MAKIRVRARTLDMLGRQQMASIPNALHELYKNAYDAYASKARTDYYRSGRILVLQDDGIGMTVRDFEDRWLTLGTESKVALTPMEMPYKDPQKAFRIPLGEKGIGRLAIATIGPQVFILSRAEREDGLQDMVVSFINWTFFEVPGLDLDAVVIPTLSLAAGKMPTEEHLKSLIEEVWNNCLSLRESLPNSYFKKISEELENVFHSLSILHGIASSLPYQNGRGTAFIIFPVEPVFERDLEDDSNEMPAPLLKVLRGLSNTMMPNDTPPPMVAEFWDHKVGGTPIELIGDKEFFTPEEFLSADQHIEGTFDEYGQFIGTVSIYKQAPQDYTVPWDGAGGNPTKCGSFKIKFAYLQGDEKESLLPFEEFRKLKDKLDKFGGLYVYRNGVRVLPYGNPDFDWLSIEVRRSKAYKDWYFSYRRIFGAVELSTPENAALNEKAGREGFRENIAYRQFKDMLENLFKQLAYDWFREKSYKYGNFWEIKEELQTKAELLKKREASVRGRKEKVKKDLDDFFNKYEQKIPHNTIETYRAKMATALESISGLAPEEAAKELLHLESEMTATLQKLRDEFRVIVPRGVGLSKTVQKELATCADLFIKLEKELFFPFEQEIGNKISEVIRETKALVSHRKRIRQALENKTRSGTQKAQKVIKQARDEAGLLQQEIVAKTRESLANLSNAYKDGFMLLERESLAEMDETSVDEFRHSLENMLAVATETEVDGLERLYEQVQAVLEAVRTGVPLTETAAALEEHSQDLEERLEKYTELAQLGTAIGIIQHEFKASVNGIRQGLQRLTTATSSNEDLSEVCRNLRSNFEHLDTYLGMFTPLNRRLYRRPLTVSGKSIREYLLQVFSERFARHQIEWESTSAFEGHSVIAYPASFLPSFINVVDNAVYWLSRDSTGTKLPFTGRRLISFDADAHGFLIKNNGPGITERDAGRIFEMSFTRKLRGQGMGLAVARKALRDAGFDLALDAVGQNMSPIFRISTVKSEATLRGIEHP